MSIKLINKDIFIIGFIGLMITVCFWSLCFVSGDSEIDAEEYKNLDLIMQSAQKEDQQNVLAKILDATKDRKVTYSEYNEIISVYVKSSESISPEKTIFFQNLEPIKDTMNRR